jgi:hypothetical protein
MNEDQKQAWERKHRRDRVVWIAGPLVLLVAAFWLDLIDPVDLEEPRGSASERTVAEACGIEVEQAREFISAVQTRDPGKYAQNWSQTDIASKLTYLLDRNSDWGCEDIARLWSVDLIK